MLSARFSSSQYPNHHFKLLLEERNADIVAPLAISLREDHAHGARAQGSCHPSVHITAASWQPAHVCTHQEGSTFPWTGPCIHNSFPPPAEKLHYSRASIETTITFLEIVLSPKSGNNLLGKSQSKPINPMIFSGSKSISETCYLLLVSPEYVLSLRALQNFVEKMVIRRMVKNKQMP